jgi:hypothetical protein
VAAKHSLDFLTMRGGGRVRNLLIKGLHLKDHPEASKFKQGYLLISVGEKNGRPRGASLAPSDKA